MPEKGIAALLKAFVCMPPKQPFSCLRVAVSYRVKHACPIPVILFKLGTPETPVDKNPCTVEFIAGSRN